MCLVIPHFPTQKFLIWNFEIKIFYAGGATPFAGGIKSRVRKCKIPHENLTVWQLTIDVAKFPMNDFALERGLRISGRSSRNDFAALKIDVYHSIGVTIVTFQKNYDIFTVVDNTVNNTSSLFVNHSPLLFSLRRIKLKAFKC